jgi:hypothetical protein
MSSTSSPGSERSASGSKGRGCKPSRSARSTRSAGKSSKSTGRKSPATRTSPRSPPAACEQMELLPTSSAAASPARTSASPERAQALAASEAAYGRSTPESFANFDPATSSWRTSQLCLDGALSEFSETWPRSGTIRSGIAYRLPPLVPRTFVIESGLLPTPAATSYGTSNNGCPGDGREEYATKGSPSLETMARRGLLPTPRAVRGKYQRSHGKVYPSLEGIAEIWPTPNASDANGARTPKQVAAMKAGAKPRKGGGKPGMTQLRDAVAAWWASPASRDWRSGRGRSENGHSPQLPEQVGGQLNPTWVEWLMGLPLGWTVASASPPPATRSSRKSRKSSGKRS